MKRLVSFLMLPLLASTLLLTSTGTAVGQTNLYSFFVAGHPSAWQGLNLDFLASYPYIQSRPEIEFGLFAGDIVASNPDTADWDFVDADVADLGIPVHFAVGNHDMENRPLFEYRYGPTYYSFESHNDLFVVLDPDLDEWNISGDQLIWLDTTLSSNAGNVDNIYVVFHQLIWRELDNQYANVDWNSDVGRGDTVNFWTEVLPLFEVLSNEVVMIAGDVGAGPWAADVMYDNFNNITIIATGMGEGIGDNFVVVNVDSNKTLSYDLVCISDPFYDCLGPLENHVPLITSTRSDVRSIASSNGFPTPGVLDTDDLTNSVLRMFDSSGRLILQETNASEFDRVREIRGLQTGIYTVVIQSDNSRTVERFAVTR